MVNKEEPEELEEVDEEDTPVTPIKAEAEEGLAFGDQAAKTLELIGMTMRTTISYIPAVCLLP